MRGLLSLGLFALIAVDAASDEGEWIVSFTKGQTTFEGLPFPLVLKRLNDIKGNQLGNFSKRNRNLLIHLAMHHGAVLLRGFPVNNATR